MGATELLKHFKALPASERSKFIGAVLDMEYAPRRHKNQARHVKWPDVETRAKRIFGERVLPNLVLLEREESPF